MIKIKSFLFIVILIQEGNDKIKVSKKGGTYMKRSIKIAATTAVAVSSAMLVKKAKENKVEEKENTYRNTELGKHDKNSKGIYYTNGNYEAFARPKKPEGVENKQAYLVGSGLASLAAACF